MDSDDDDFRDRDYDISTMAQNLTREVYCTTDMFDNEDIDEVFLAIKHLCVYVAILVSSIAYVEPTATSWAK